MKKTFYALALLATAGGFALTSGMPGYAANTQTSAAPQTERTTVDTRYQHVELNTRSRWRCWWRRGERWCGWW